MTTLWTGPEIAHATGGKLSGDFAASDLSIDTRTLKRGELFVPLVDQRDGHEFIPAAFERGASGTLSAQGLGGRPGVEVGDTLGALRGMAEAARDRAPAVRIGVTGSVGKTSLKEAIATICATAGPTHKSIKSFNNHWGVPLTLARMPRDTQFGVFEMGMNHAGELSELSALVQPDIAVVTKIAPAHLEHFASVDDIAKAKAEIFSGLVKGGRAIINADDPYGARLARVARTHGAQVTTVGRHEKADMRIGDSQSLLDGSVFTLHHRGEIHAVRVGIAGDHWVQNAALAIACAYAAGIPVVDAAEALSDLAPLKGRGARFVSTVNEASVTVVDESYNANPESMRAAITALADTPGRKIAVLGEMLELGEDAPDLHAALSHPLHKSGFTRVITVGETMRSLRAAMPRRMQATWARDADAAWDALLGELRDGDTVLIKGSNGARLGGLVDRLQRLGFSQPQRLRRGA